MKYFLLFLIFTASCLNAINFKEGNKTFPYHLWFSAGLGSMWTEDTSMPNLYASINFSKNNHILKLRAIGGGGIQSPPDTERAGDIGLLYGYKQSFGNIHLSYLAGIGLTAGKYKSDRIDENFSYLRYQMIDYETISLPLEIQLDLNRARPFGLGLSAFGNINAEKSFAGISLNLLIGRLP